MKTAILKINSYAKKTSIINNNDLERNILRSILFSIGFLGLCYVIIIGNMVFNIVERRSLEANARILSSEVGELELQYLSASNNVDLVFAKSKGFKEPSVKKFSTRQTFGNISFAKNEL